MYTLYTAACRRFVYALLLCMVLVCWGASAQTITHQISLPQGTSWCSDQMIDGLLFYINSLRNDRGLSPLVMDPTGMRVAETRAVQFSAYMAAHLPGSPGFDPHQGWDQTATSLGYNIVSENLAYLTSQPGYIVYVVWQGPLHLGAMLSSSANVAGVSCVFANGGTPYWTYTPGIASTSPGPNPPAPPPPAPPPPVPGGTPSLDGEQSAFLTLINNYRAQNGAPPLQVSLTLQNAAQWMSNDLATHNYASHTDSLGRTMAVRLAAFGYSFVPMGENIAGGYADAQSTFSQWLNACDPDPTGQCTYAHRKNMLHAGFAAIGIGRAYHANSSYGWYWTTDFGGYLDKPLNSPPPVPVPAPAIVSFTATPSSISPGQSATLSWNVTGASSVAINNGVGTVSGGGSRSVSPTQTVVYTLTASNSSGTSTRTVTVTVTPPTGDKQPPSAPKVVSATASSPARVTLTWTASTDNIGVAGYEVLRNGIRVATAGRTSLSYTDTTVSPNSQYSYAVRAYDTAGNYSGLSNAVQVTTPGVPASGVCPAPSTNIFTGCYFNNITLSGPPALIRSDPQINFNWGTGSPASTVSADAFSARWQGYFHFNQGTYTFTATTSDGMRVYVDGQLILDRWRDQPGYTYTARHTLTQGSHLVTVEYYSHSGLPIAQLRWQ
jgi:uncharacterized protein YkwD